MRRKLDALWKLLASEDTAVVVQPASYQYLQCRQELIAMNSDAELRRLETERRNALWADLVNRRRMAKVDASDFACIT